MELSRSEKRILTAYTGGRTEEEALITTKNKPKRRQHKEVRRRLVDKGEIKDLGPCDGRRHKWIPAAQINQATGGKKKTIPLALGPKQIALIKAGEDLFWRIGVAKSKINAGEAWRKPRHIRSICINDIQPIVCDAVRLGTVGVRVSLPWEFFKESTPPLSRGFFRERDLRGPLLVKIETRTAQESIYPSLPEWEEYLMRLLEELEPIHSMYCFGILSRVLSKDGTPKEGHQSTNDFSER